MMQHYYQLHYYVFFSALLSGFVFTSSKKTKYKKKQTKKFLSYRLFIQQKHIHLTEKKIFVILYGLQESMQSFLSTSLALLHFLRQHGSHPKQDRILSLS